MLQGSNHWSELIICLAGTNLVPSHIGLAKIDSSGLDGAWQVMDLS